MQTTKILNIAALALVVLAFAVDRIVPRIAIYDCVKLPVDTFPRTVNEWSAPTDRPVDPDMKRRLSTATIVERNYSDSANHQVDLMLLTASAAEDYHNPNVCLPSQGWDITSNHITHQWGHEVHWLQVEQGINHLTVAYWVSGRRMSAAKHVGLERTAYKVRARFMPEEEGDYLFVRAMCRGNADDQAAMTRMLAEVQPPLLDLAKTTIKTSPEINS